MAASKNFISKFGMIAKQTNRVSIHYNKPNIRLFSLSAVSTSSHLNNVISGGGINLPKSFEVEGTCGKG